MPLSKRSLLAPLLLLACLWQALGSIGYMTIFAASALAPILYGGVKVCMALLPVGGRGLGWTPRAFFRGWGVRDVLLGVGIGVGFFLVLIGCYSLFPGLFAGIAAEAPRRAEAFHIGSPLVFLLVGVLFSLFHSLFEEYYWRWFIYDGLRTFCSTTLAIILSGLAFSLHHIVILSPFFPLSLAILFGLLVGAVGSFWSYLYTRQGNLVAPWISHIAADLAIILVAYTILF